MKKHIMLCIIIAVACSTQAKSLYNYAIELNSLPTLLDTSSGKIKFIDSGANFMKILSPFAQENNLDLYQIIKDFKKNNPFIIVPTNSNQSIKTSELFSPAISFIGGLPVSNIAEGLASFLVERTKEELNIAFFKKFEEYLNKPENNIIRVLFPKSCNILFLIKDEIYNYQMYLVTLREAFTQDIENILINTRKWVSSDDPLAQKIRVNDTLYSSAALALDVCAGIQKGIHPGDLLHNVRQDSTIFTTNINVRSLIILADIISQSLRSETESNQYWITAEQFERLKNDKFRKIYLGLLYEVSSGINFVKSDTISFQTMLKTATTNIDAIIAGIQDLFNEFLVINNALNSIRQNNGKGSFADYRTIGMAVFSIFEKCRLLPPVTVQLQGKAYLEHIEFVYSHTADLVVDIRSHAYASAVFECCIILDTLIPNKNEQVKMLFKYGTVIATIANAKNSQEVQDALNAFALPPGSAMIKRKTCFNVALNAYVAGYGGKEYLVINNKKEQPAASFGLTAPVGVAVSWGIGKSNALSLFVSVIDVGALTSFRINDTTASELPEVKFANIFSPGANIVWGTPLSPLSIGVGCQYGPNLRDINEQGTTINNKKFYRFHGFFGVDMPLFNFVTTSKD
jgi:hypothetical protein